MLAMTAKDREMLIRIDEKTTEMHKVLFGNGQPGLVEKFGVVEHNQVTCLTTMKESNKQRRIDFKWAIIVLLCLVDAWFVYKRLK